MNDLEKGKKRVRALRQYLAEQGILLTEAQATEAVLRTLEATEAWARDEIRRLEADD